MTGLTKKYKEYLNDSYSPIDINTLPAFVDMRAMFEYAKKKCVQISQLTKEEKSKFLIPNTRVSAP